MTQTKNWAWVSFYLLFSVLAVLLMVLPFDGFPRGWRIALLVAFFHVGLAWVLWQQKQEEDFQLWLFLLFLSIFQVLPDWFLSAKLQSLYFFPDGFYKIGTVSAYMAGLWTIPLFLVVKIAKMIVSTPTQQMGLGGLVSGIVFGLSEAFSDSLLGIWQAKGVAMWANMAIYVIPAEVVLGVLVVHGAQSVAQSAVFHKIGMALWVALSYTGALACSYLFLA